MTKNNEPSWNKTISEHFNNQKEIDEKLSPNKGELRYITDLARNIDKKVQIMDNASEMAHQGIVSLEIAQKILDTQKDKIEKDIKHLKIYLELNDDVESIIAEQKKTIEQYHHALETIFAACKRTTFNDCGGLRSIVYDIAYDILKKT